MTVGTGDRTVPWYRRTLRWGQTNLTEIDSALTEIEDWKAYWRRTRVQGLIVNAGGIVAYYPTSFPLQYRAQGLGERDLFGLFVGEARSEGLAVVARMDINRATEAFYRAHPDWFVVDADGKPYRSNGRYFSCVNSPYYKEYIPAVLGEIIERYRPDGFADNSWTGVSRNVVCHCAYCRDKFRKECDAPLPAAVDWDDPIFRRWVDWSYRCRTENWELFNDVTRRLGGEHCVWAGMVHGGPVNTHSFCDLKEIVERAALIMCDHQSRDAWNGFEQNGVSGYLLNELSGWSRIVAESMASYVRGPHMFRKASNPPEETRLWMLEGIAGGIAPWYHHIGAVQEDRRQFRNAPPVMQWHAENEAYLFHREPLATVGLVWSQANADYYGRGDAKEKVSLPWHGFVRALTKFRIPYVPVHADHIDRAADRVGVLVLPDVAVLTDEQINALRRFVEGGGSLVFTGATGTLDRWGERRMHSPFSALTGIEHAHEQTGAVAYRPFDLEIYDAHTYVRLPAERHAILRGFDDTDILPFGGKVHRLRSSGALKPIARLVPEFPIYPPEFSWMQEPSSDIPVVLAGDHPAGGRMVYFAGDADRCYGRTHLPDLGALLANAVRWADGDRIPLHVEGPGYIDCKLYRQEERVLLHLVNLSGANEYPGYVEEHLPVGPIAVSLRTDPVARPLRRVRSLRSGKTIASVQEGEAIAIRIDALIDHELIVFEP